MEIPNIFGRKNTPPEMTVKNGTWFLLRVGNPISQTYTEKWLMAKVEGNDILINSQKV
jgi:hypothetical protein